MDHIPYYLINDVSVCRKDPLKNEKYTQESFRMLYLIGSFIDRGCTRQSGSWPNQKSCWYKGPKI